MKQLNIIAVILTLSLLSYQCDKPDAFDQEAKLKIENTSTSNYITGVYFSTVGYGSNRISTNIGPGESKTFTISANLTDDNVYDIKVTSNNPSLGDYTRDHYEFHWNIVCVVELTDTEWYDDFW